MKKIFGLFLIIGSWSLMAMENTPSFNDYFYSLTNQALDEKNVISALSAYFGTYPETKSVIFGEGNKTVRVSARPEGGFSIYFHDAQVYYNLKLSMDGTGQLFENKEKMTTHGPQKKTEYGKKLEVKRVKESKRIPMIEPIKAQIFLFIAEKLKRKN